ncbi:MAG TPA: hypothetical protein VLA48_05280 [Nitrososphaeraceae archaeon]|nr:hypothetical protein [Nitrososphaeraceae archaeon]
MPANIETLKECETCDTKGKMEGRRITGQSVEDKLKGGRQWFIFIEFKPSPKFEIAQKAVLI